MRETKLVLITVILIASTAVCAQSQAAKAETCTVQGTVVAAATGEPLKSAQVTLEMQSGQYESFKESTDSNGHFVITNVPAGHYQFYATKSGYFRQGYRINGSRPSINLDLEPGEKLDRVQFRLSRAAVIVGRVTDETGEPVAGVEMDALVSIDDDSPMRFIESDPKASGKFAVTNDLGEYRIYDLPPGSYYLTATDSGSSGYLNSPDARRGRQTDHPTVFYPGVIKRSEAQRINVKAGQEAHIDLSLRREKMLSVSGRVFDANGSPGAHVFVTISPQDPDPNFWVHSDYTSQTNSEGRFEIDRIFPGSYRVSAVLEPLAVAGQVMEYRQYWAEQQVEVAESNISGIELHLNPSVKLSGKVKATGESKVDLQNVQVEIVAETGRYHGAITQMKADGTFTIDVVRRTAHYLRVTGLPEGWYLRSAVFGSQNVLKEGLQLAGADIHQPLQITISPGAAQVKGTLLKGTDPVAGAMVILFPEPANSHRTDLLRTMRTDKEGKFLITNVVPGSYHLFAMDAGSETEDNENSPADTTIVLAEKESKTVQLNLNQTPE